MHEIVIVLSRGALAICFQVCSSCLLHERRWWFVMGPQLVVGRHKPLRIAMQCGCDVATSMDVQLHLDVLDHLVTCHATRTQHVIAFRKHMLCVL